MADEDKDSDSHQTKIMCLDSGSSKQHIIVPSYLDLSSIAIGGRYTVDTWPTDPSERLAIARHTFGEYGGVNKSIEASTTFTVMDTKMLSDIFTGKKGVDIRSSLLPPNAPESMEGFFLYGRHFNPTVLALGREIAALEATEAAYPTASGMSAILCTVLAICNSGDHIVASDTLYGGTFAALKEFLPTKMKISTTFVNINNLADVEKAVTPNTKMIYTETLSNPTLNFCDIKSLSDIAKKHSIKLVIDNTFTPLIISPSLLGADVVIHSLTKFINGTSDIIAGVICSSSSFVSSLMDLHLGPLMLLGPVMDPKMAAEISLRLPTLPLRIREHSRRAMYFAKNLSGLGLKVTYPGLSTHPHHHLMTALSNKNFGYGGILTIDFGSKQLGFGFSAVSLGYFDTLMSCSAASTSSELSDEDLKKAHITPGLVRFSIGITGTLGGVLQETTNISFHEMDVDDYIERLPRGSPPADIHR